MRKTTTVEIRNDFHNTSINIRIPADGAPYRLSPSQVKRVASLCGNEDCQCYATNPVHPWIFHYLGQDDRGDYLVVREFFVDTIQEWLTPQDVDPIRGWS